MLLVFEKVNDSSPSQLSCLIFSLLTKQKVSSSLEMYNLGKNEPWKLIENIHLLSLPTYKYDNNLACWDQKDQSFPNGTKKYLRTNKTSGTRVKIVGMAEKLGAASYEDFSDNMQSHRSLWCWEERRKQAQKR